MDNDSRTGRHGVDQTIIQRYLANLLVAVDVDQHYVAGRSQVLDGIHRLDSVRNQLAPNFWASCERSDTITSIREAVK
jgi:hypothetical protein